MPPAERRLLVALPTRMDLQEVTSLRWRSSSRRSLSVMPPQTPHSIRLSRASARHSKRTGHPEHTSRALFWSDASGNRASSIPRHLARMVQSSRCTAVTLHLPFVNFAVPGFSPARVARRMTRYARRLRNR